jgi:flagellar basal body-associated protein FliL
MRAVELFRVHKAKEGRMTDSAITASTTKSRKKSAIIAVLTLGLIFGSAGGGAYWWLSKAPQETINVADERDAHEPMTEYHQLAIGKITVVLKDYDDLTKTSTKRHMLVDVVLTYALRFVETENVEHANDSVSGRVAAIRDSYIEYLSQLSSKELEGSAGMAMLRQELLRRARLVVGSDAPQAVLIQDFVLQ